MLVRCLEPLSAAIKKNFSRIAPSLNAGSARSAHVNLANSTLDLAETTRKIFTASITFLISFFGTLARIFVFATKR